jgi:hypothetical protein
MMYSPTAASTNYISGSIHLPFGSPAALPAVAERFRRFTRPKAEVRVSDAKPEDAIYTPTAGPAWLDNTLSALRRSVAPGAEHVTDGQWLAQDVVNAAADFFRTAADLLPAEPFIYSSRGGELVAEFTVRGHGLTIVVSPNRVLFFADVDGRPPVEAISTDPQRTREDVRRVTRSLVER